MGATPGTLLDRINRIITGNGFKRTIDGTSLYDLTEAAGNHIGASTTPPIAAIETYGVGVAVAAGTTFAGCLNVRIPRDYDESLDILKVNILAVSAGTDVPTLTCTAYRKRTGVAMSSALTVVASAAIPTVTALAAWRTINISGNSLKGGDVVHIALATAAHASHVANLLAIEVEYRGDLAYFLVEDR